MMSRQEVITWYDAIKEEPEFHDQYTVVCKDGYRRVAWFHKDDIWEIREDDDLYRAEGNEEVVEWTKDI